MLPLKSETNAQSHSNNASFNNAQGTKKGRNVDVSKSQKSILSFLTKGGLPTPSKDHDVEESSLAPPGLKTPPKDTIKENYNGRDKFVTPTKESTVKDAFAEHEKSLPVDTEDKEEEETITFSRRSTRLGGKRKILIESEDEEKQDTNKVDFAESPKKLPLQKKPRRKLNYDSEDNDWELDEKSTKKVSPSKVPPSKLKAFASSSTSNRGSSFSSTTIFTESEKKKQRAADFKAKNEERYSWLLEVKDKEGNPEGSPNYDPRTLYIPPSAWSKFTPFEKQFWEIKSAHWDTVVFFKKGKFYELYERDADIGHTEFDLKLTDRVNMRMVGVPEMSFDHWAAQFIAKGYKVAKVDQMETALGKEMREKATKSKEEKVIRRELTSILTAGTLVEGGLLTNDMGTYCLSIKEEITSDNELPEFGICFVDTATGEFNLASFKDDINRTKFETLIMQLKPREIVFEKGKLSQRSHRILKSSIPSLIWNGLAPDNEFWNAETTLYEIRISGYFSNKRKNNNDGNNDEEMNDASDESMESYPLALKEACDKPLMMSALGGLLWYLRSLKLDLELASLGNFHIYDPIRHTTSLILDGQTLLNLEVFENSFDGSEEGTLFKLLNRCITPFGKRTFKLWLCHPSRNAKAINERLDAIEELRAAPEFQDEFHQCFTQFPDLERLISRIHAGTCSVKNFLIVLAAFRKLMTAIEAFNKYTKDFKSQRLLQLFEMVPDLNSKLDYFNSAFDYEEATTSNLIPYPGIEIDYDEINETLRKINQQLQNHLTEVKRKLGIPKAVYKDVGKEIYQIEIPIKVKVPDDWRKLSGTKTVNRYWNPTLQKLIRELQEAQETQANILKSLRGRFYEKFDAHYQEWLVAVKIVAEVDCLLSLTKSSLALGEPCCRPEFVEEGPSFLKFEDLRHPCVVPGVATDFIPNDTYLGDNEPNVILLTGPNMGGKSTLLRQNCVAIIMAQLGCYVPARRCVLTPFDRIYTRIGANDNIMAGQSTFMVELTETSKILHEATPRSMVILDELGRGTSTFDGYAIAYSVLHYLATHIGCLALFSTHYGTLTQEFAKNPNIALKHMSCQVDQDRKEVTFLYKLVPGVCPKSYGMNVASMAGVPRVVVERAEEIAAKFEQSSRLNDTLTSKESDLPATLYSDFAHLLRAATSAAPSDGVCDRALDNQTEIEKKQRQARVLSAIIRRLKKL
ncbi:11757_t:CDS:10 [Ambispora leptoticha]|uniref:DNA mismatch repair protein n=1 Tax=Ambispora leptoticha TaxID=144679 RepID=A0A9N8YSC2_9GLOM|nr:11757_t:CDS:10 [Ambispora leptoticha]